jgi:hypothetical protein
MDLSALFDYWKLEPSKEAKSEIAHLPKEQIITSSLPSEPGKSSESVSRESRKVSFYDTYNQFGDNPSIMWGDLNWEGWFDTKQPLTKEPDGWYSFVMPTQRITDSYNMLIFFNGLPDDDPNAIQWVWNINNGAPKGNYFAADNKNPKNKPEEWFKGVQRNATSFATKEEAKSALGIK